MVKTFVLRVNKNQEISYIPDISEKEADRILSSPNQDRVWKPFPYGEMVKLKDSISKTWGILHKHFGITVISLFHTTTSGQPETGKIEISEHGVFVDGSIPFGLITPDGNAEYLYIVKFPYVRRW